MFDVSFSELMLIGVIALIVIGPERLPKVARTLGHLVGRAQRYVNDVKTDIQREMDLDELNNLKAQMQDAAKSVKDSMDDASKSLRAPMEDAQKALRDASASVESLVKAETQAATPDSAAEQAKAAAQAVGVEPAEDPILVAARAAEAEANLPLPGFESSPATSLNTASGAIEPPVPGVPPGPTGPGPGPDVTPPPGVPPAPGPTPEPDVPGVPPPPQPSPDPAPPGVPPPTQPRPEPDVPGVPPGLGARRAGSVPVASSSAADSSSGSSAPQSSRSTVSETP